MMTKLLSRVRGLSEPALVVLLGLMLLPVFLATDLYLGRTTMPGTLGASALMAVALLSLRLRSGLRDYVLATAVLAEVMVLTADYQMHPWQIDTHMVYFVMLAGVSVLGRVGVMLYAAGIVAVHHVSLTLLLPAAVYPSTDLIENIMRTALHAGIVVMETAILTMAILQRNAFTRSIEESRELLADESHKAAAAQARAEAAAQETRDVVAQFNHHLHRLADRDLACAIDAPMPEAFETLRHDFNRAVRQLEEALRSAGSKAVSFEEEAQALEAVTGDLSSRSERQAHELSAATHSMSDITQALNATADQASTASERASIARQSAEQGGAVTNEAIQAMNLIEQSSSEVGKIIDLIDDISFQTNLLALNAGVEAARAGESGKGFAVVAAEVRQLAQRTSEAAAGVKTLILDSEAQVTNGARLVNEAGARLSSIVDEVSAVSGMIAQIRDESRGQSGGTSDLSQTLARLDSETQDTAGLSEEMAAMGLRLRSHARELLAEMGAFHLDGEDPPAASHRQSA
ncbi:methyl-accepting chemotaxis protein [Salipiger bermudensis]|uniref:methyl-accepting chemotaxis protein n=1 Tax=Salipiger bermudensis TaxID=344736 RepID=UPI003518D001